MAVCIEAGRATSNWVQYLTVICVTSAVVIACVILHYEALSSLTKILRRVQLPPRSRILLLIGWDGKRSAASF